MRFGVATRRHLGTIPLSAASSLTGGSHAKTTRDPALLEDERTPLTPTESPIEADPIATGRRVGDRTNVHDEGSDANDTPDGLTESEEAVRLAAEDVPSGQSLAGPIDAVPVFDRSGLPPKV